MTIRWGIVGCGDVTEVKSGPALSRVAGSTLQAVMRRDAARAEDYARRHGVPRWTTDASEIIDADDVDAVYVATPPASHLEYVLHAARAGKPVLVEKPMARDALEAEAMVAACAEAGVPLFVAYYRRALPRFEFVRELVGGGGIGEPRLVQLELHRLPPADGAAAGWRWDPAVGGDGLLLDLGSHGLDLLDHVLGPLEDVQGVAAARAPWSGVPDLVAGTFTAGGTVVGTASWDFGATALRDRTVVFGSAGRVEVPVFDEGPVILVDALGRVTERLVPHPPHVHEPLVARIVAELAGEGPPSPSTGLSGLRAQVAIDRLLEGWRSRARG